MRKLLSFSLALGVLCCTTSVIGAQPADAKPWKKRVNHRQKKQQKRIWGGAKNGSLTKKEFYRLQKGQKRLNKMEKNMRQSGNGLSKREAVKLEHAQDRLSKNIYKQKHDGQSR